MTIGKDKLDRAIALMKKGPANAEYFFEQLKSPGWIEPLAKEKLFTKPQAAVRRGDTIQFPSWVPGQYLARMATVPEAQGQVLEILKNLPKSDNPRVYEVVADAAAAMPPNLARRLIPQLVLGVQLPFQFLLPEKIASLVSRLADADLCGEALGLAKALFAIMPSPDSSREGEDETPVRWIPREPKGRFDDWLYSTTLEQCVKSLVRSCRLEALCLLCELLEAAIAEGRMEREEGPEDHSYIWRPTIEHSERPRENVRDSLASAVRDAGNQVIAFSPELLPRVVEHLQARSTRVFHRIALYLLNVHGELSLPLVQKSLESPEDWEDDGLEPEYEHLLARFFTRLPADIQQRFLDWIDKGPDIESYVAFREQMDGHEPPNVDIARHRDVWIRDHLGVIAGDLTPAQRDRFDGLVAAHGAPRESGRRVRVSVVSRGERSPLTEEETLSLEWPSLIAKMRDWSPPSADFDGLSKEGLAGSIRQRVAANPREAIQHLRQVEDVDPQYVAAILEALRDSLKKREAMEWQPLLAFLARMVDEAQAAPDKIDLWRWVSKCAASLIGGSFDLGPASLPVEARQEVWPILQRLAENPDPTPEHEGRYGGDNMDPATLSLNTVRGETFHGVIRYALWWRRHLESLADSSARLMAGFRELPEVRALLERHLDSTQDPSLAVRAVYGQWFPWIVLLDPSWAADHTRDIFPSDAESSALFWAAWGAYVVFCQPFTNLLPILRDEYAQAIGAVQEGLTRKAGMVERPSEHLAEHIVAYYWRGELTLAKDDLVAAFFKAARPKLRGHGLEWTGRVLMQLHQPLSPEAQNRLTALWEWRAKQAPIATEELQAFGWWFASGQLDQGWCFDVLETLLFDAVLPEPDHMVVERLAAIAENYPVLAVKCLARMVDLGSNDWSIHGWLGSARTILVAGLKSTDADANQRSEGAIHKLGALGFRDFRDVLKKVGES